MNIDTRQNGLIVSELSKRKVESGASHLLVRRILVSDSLYSFVIDAGSKADCEERREAFLLKLPEQDGIIMGVMKADCVFPLPRIFSF